MNNSLKTHCVHGHSLADAYIIHRSNGYTFRACRGCRFARTQREKKPPKPRAIKSIAERFFKFTGKQSYNECWNWRGARQSGGYGRIKRPGKHETLMAHRVAWELFHGKIPKGLVVDHLCRNTGCVNPTHLRICSTRDNVLAPHSQSPSALNSRKTHCNRGHPLKDAYIEVTKKGVSRRCRICGYLTNKKWKETHS